LHVRFAVGLDEADDLIELLIRRASSPRQLTVVSDDHRIQQAARRRHCTALGCAAYLDWLDRQRRPKPPPPAEPPDAAEKMGPPADQESPRGRREFADLADDPALKDLFAPFGFHEGEAPPPAP